MEVGAEGLQACESVLPPQHAALPLRAAVRAALEGKKASIRPVACLWPPDPSQSFKATYKSYNNDGQRANEH